MEDLNEFNYWAGIESLKPTAAKTSGRGIAKKLDF
jgi:hypothetical protein